MSVAVDGVRAVYGRKTHLPDTPSEQLRMSLARQKAVGTIPFDLAWRQALQIVRYHWAPGELREWHALIADPRIRGAFQSAYENVDTPMLATMDLLASTLRSD